MACNFAIGGCDLAIDPTSFHDTMEKTGYRHERALSRKKSSDVLIASVLASITRCPASPKAAYSLASSRRASFSLSSASCPFIQRLATQHNAASARINSGPKTGAAVIRALLAEVTSISASEGLLRLEPAVERNSNADQRRKERHDLLLRAAIERTPKPRRYDPADRKNLPPQNTRLIPRLV